MDRSPGGMSNCQCYRFGRPCATFHGVFEKLPVFPVAICFPIIFTREPPNVTVQSDISQSDASQPDTLVAALGRHDIDLPEPQVARLERYCELLWEWNAKINLTRHTDYEKFVARDVVDSLAIAEFLRSGEKILDVGTGGGVPGIVLAIVRDDLDVSLSEQVGKKAKAVADIVSKLELDVPVFQSRAEEVLLAGQSFDSLVVRAVGRLHKLLTWFAAYWGTFDRLLVVKGPAWVEERGEARHLGLMKDLALRKLKSYPMPGTDSESVLLQICPEDRLAELERAESEE